MYMYRPRCISVLPGRNSVIDGSTSFYLYCILSLHIVRQSLLIVRPEVLVDIWGQILLDSLCNVTISVTEISADPWTAVDSVLYKTSHQEVDALSTSWIIWSFEYLLEEHAENKHSSRYCWYPYIVYWLPIPFLGHLI